ncbi:hypothetical protein [Cellvibrio sp. OA-2007]|uniref:hypothetical protein n=1 Tax=Cellvibrio sp. OA-2007 TaxID=529823 RepID=UPI0007806295|nr:hypothetical protein [Cellvibrio sp. OA-2007]
MNPLDSKDNCTKCKSFRDLCLHLHELFLFCELLNNDHPVFKMDRKAKVESGRAKTANIAKWLRLASQISSVEMNMFRYEEAHQYCEPVADALQSNADHFSSIITPLTRFIFVANALEEAYRFASPVYEDRLETYKNLNKKIERKRDYSMQASWVLEENLSSTNVPKYYEHKVEILQCLSKKYQSNFNVKFDTNLESKEGISYGLSLVRDIRNQVAHAEFPIIDDPEYALEFSNPNNKHLILRLLQHATRIAAMNIQMLLLTTNDGFNSDEYRYLCDDPDFGDRLQALCTIMYLKNLHLNQEFGLNESTQWRLHQVWREQSAKN